MADDTNGEEDVFVHDRFTGATTRVSVATGGAQGTGNSYDSSISANGQYVAFSTVAANLMTNVFHLQFDPNRVTGRGIVVHDRQSGLTTAVGAGHGPSISADGLFVTFHAGPEQLYFGPDTYSPERTEVFVHDRSTATTTWVSRSSTGAAGDESSSYATISGDGRFVAFISYATNLVAGDSNATADVFVHDRRMGTTTRVTVSGDGTQGDGGSSGPSISADGRYLAFSSTGNVFVQDRQLGATRQVGVAGYRTDVSDDGNHVSFNSGPTRKGLMNGRSSFITTNNRSGRAPSVGSRATLYNRRRRSFSRTWRAKPGPRCTTRTCLEIARAYRARAYRAGE